MKLKVPKIIGLVAAKLIAVLTVLAMLAFEPKYFIWILLGKLVQDYIIPIGLLSFEEIGSKVSALAFGLPLLLKGADRVHHFLSREV